MKGKRIFPFALSLVLVWMLVSLSAPNVQSASLLAEPFQQGDSSSSTQPIKATNQFGGLTGGLAVRENLVYLGIGSRLVVIDVTEKIAPRVVGQTDVLPGLVHDVVLGENHAFIALGNEGLSVIDVADPTAPQEVASLESTAAIRAIALAGSYLYYLAEDFTVIDVSDPTTPHIAGTVTGLVSHSNASSIMVSGNYAYLVEGDFAIFDISNPTAPQHISTGGTLCGSPDLSFTGNFVLIADDDCGVLFVDVSDPTIMFTTADFFLTSDHEHAFYPIKSDNRHFRRANQIESLGNYAFISYEDGLQILEIGDPRNPRPIGDLSYPETLDIGGANDIVVADGFVYFSDSYGGLSIINIQNPATPNFVRYLNILGPTEHVATFLDQVLAVDPKNVYELNVESPTLPVIDWWGNEEFLNDMELADGIGYFTTSRSLTLLNLYGEPRPEEIAVIEPGSFLFETVVADGQVYLFDEDEDRMRIMDATNPFSPKELTALPIPSTLSSSLNKVVVDKKLAFLLFGNASPWVIDLSTSIPREIGFLGNTPILGMVVLDNHAYAAAGESGLFHYDITDIQNPRLLDPLPEVINAHNVFQVDRYLLVVDADGTGKIFDAQLPGTPTLVSTLRLPPTVKDVTMVGANVFIAAGDHGLWFYNVPGIESPEESGGEQELSADFPLSEAILIRRDETKNLVLENVDTGVVVPLTDTGNVTNFRLSPSRQHVLFDDPLSRIHRLTLDFRSDGSLRLIRGTRPFPVRRSAITWSPDSTKFTYESEGFQTLAFRITGDPIELPEGVVNVGGWSYDNQWLSYCLGGGTLGILNEAEEAITIDSGVICSPILSPGPALWSPTALMLAYAQGTEMTSTFGVQPVVYDLNTQERFTLPENNGLRSWSPDGRFLALSNESLPLSIHRPVEIVTHSFTISDFQGEHELLIEESSINGPAEVPGQQGWIHTTEGEILYGRYALHDELMAADPIADALFDVTPDGLTWLIARQEGDGYHIVCQNRSTGQEQLLFSKVAVAQPDSEQRPLRLEPTIFANLSPTGDWAIISGGGLVYCNPGSNNSATNAINSQLGNISFSSDGKRFMSTVWSDGSSTWNLYTVTEDSYELQKTYSAGLEEFTWLVTPDVAPPVTQVITIAGRVTDHDNTPLAGVQVTAGDDLETVTDADGRYRFTDIEDGTYTVVPTLEGYTFPVAEPVAVPPSQTEVNFTAQPIARHAINGRITDCQGHPLPGVTLHLNVVDLETVTDEDGRYQFEEIERHNYTVTAEINGYTFLPSQRQVNFQRYAPGESLTVDFVATAAGSAEFCIPHIEITQVVQDEFNSAPLITAKPAVLRAYVDCGVGCESQENVTGTLRAYDAAGQPITTATGDSLSAGPITAFHVHWISQRGEQNRTLNFLLPQEWLEGEVRFIVTTEGAQAELPVEFEPGKLLRIYHLPYTYIPPTDPNIPAPVPTPLPIIDASVIEDGYEALVTMLPLAPDDLTYLSQTGIRQSIDVPFTRDGEPMNAERYLVVLNDYWVRQEQTGGWRDGHTPDRLIAWVTESPGAVSGIADSRYLSNRGVVAGVTMDSNTVFGLLRFPWGAFSLVHELGHLLDDTGLQHTPYVPNPDTCTTEVAEGIATDFPNFVPQGSIGDWGVYISGNSFELINPINTFDIMSYCQIYWISLHNYKRFHEGFMPLADVSESADMSDPSPNLLVSGIVHSSTQTAELSPIYRVESAAPPTPEGSGDYCIVLRDAADTALTRHCFDLAFRENISGQPTNTDSFSLAVPWIDGAVAAVVTHGDQELGRVTASSAPPMIRTPRWVLDSSPLDAPLLIQWEASDTDGDPLHYTVSLSSDEGQTWNPIAMNISEPELTLDPQKLPGNERTLVQVEVSDGFHSTAAVSTEAFQVASKPPQAVILSPGSGETVIADKPLWLQGTAFDLEDGTLDDTSLVWSIGEDEELGRGQQLFVSLPPGVHLVRLTAVDSDDQTTTSEIQVEAVVEESKDENEETGEAGQSWISQWLGLLVVGLGLSLFVGMIVILKRRP